MPCEYPVRYFLLNILNEGGIPSSPLAKKKYNQVNMIGYRVIWNRLLVHSSLLSYIHCVVPVDLFSDSLVNNYLCGNNDVVGILFQFMTSEKLFLVSIWTIWVEWHIGNCDNANVWVHLISVSLHCPRILQYCTKKEPMYLVDFLPNNWVKNV